VKGIEKSGRQLKEGAVRTFKTRFGCQVTVPVDKNHATSDAVPNQD